MANKRLVDANALWTDIMMLPHNGDMISSEEVEQVIIDAPTVDAVEVVHGWWEPRQHYKFNNKGALIEYCKFFHCSECGTERPIVPPYNYCPNCGAKMDGGPDHA